MIYMSLWYAISWMKIAILLGYIGVIISIINLGRKYVLNSYRKEQSVQKYSEETILNIKKFLRFFFLFVVLAGIITYAGLWSIQRPLSIEYIHLLILTGAYIAITYMDFSMKEKSFHTSSSKPQEPQDIYLATIKKIWHINPVILLAFCIFYTQVNPYPFWGIWGIIAWASSVLATYPVIPLMSSDMFRELKVTEKKRSYIFIIILSWVLAVFFLDMPFSVS